MNNSDVCSKEITSTRIYYYIIVKHYFFIVERIDFFRNQHFYELGGGGWGSKQCETMCITSTSTKSTIRENALYKVNTCHDKCYTYEKVNMFLNKCRIQVIHIINVR